MYIIDPTEELTPSIIGKIISNYQTGDLPRLTNYKNYYDGRQKITAKTPTDTGKPDNRVVVNYCNSIVNNYNGYITGKPISYNNDSVDFSIINEILKYNDTPDEDTELLRQALIYGVAYEINYIDADKKQRFRVLDARECIPIYDNTLDENLLYVIRFYSDKIYRSSSTKTEDFIVEVYGKDKITTYKSSAGFKSFNLISEIPHYYGQVPITVFTLNKDGTNIFDKIISLQDAYNEVVSDSLNDYNSFADAYMIIKGMSATDEDLENMKEHRVLLLDSDADAQYLTKSFTDAQTENILTNLNKKIHSIANSPDFTDETFMAESGIALKYKLVGFENMASAIESQMRKALTKRIELISAIIAMTDDDIVWRDVDIQFHRNLPTDMTESVNVVSALQGIVSDETLLGLLPFVNDPIIEAEKVRKQKETNMSLFDFSTSSNVEDLNDDEEPEVLGDTDN